jgi:hypothetical protein
MTVKSGKAGRLHIGATMVAYLKDVTWSESAGVAEAEYLEGDWKDTAPTTKEWEASATGYWDPADSGQDAVVVGSTVTLNIYPEGNSASKTYFTGSAVITKKGRNAAVGGFVECDFSFKGNGSLTEGTVSA